jgi:hypothetical protein
MEIILYEAFCLHTESSFVQKTIWMLKASALLGLSLSKH